MNWFYVLFWFIMACVLLYGWWARWKPAGFIAPLFTWACLSWLIYLAGMVVVILLGGLVKTLIPFFQDNPLRAGFVVLVMLYGLFAILRLPFQAARGVASTIERHKNS